MPDCIHAVEQAFWLLGSGRASRPVVSSVRAAEGGFHIKSALITVGDGEYFISKTNANYPANASTHGLPTIQGTIVVHSASNGAPLAVIDSIEITAMRTAAATAVAARYLAREDAGELAVIGCGTQGYQHVRALCLVRTLRSVSLFDVDESAARTLAERIKAEWGFPVRVTSSIGDAVGAADLIVTCTTSTDFLLSASDIQFGAFVAGVGVDAEHKRELAPDLLKKSRVVVDVLEQCIAFGDLHHAIERGVMTTADVHAELGGIVAGGRVGRSSPEETFVFDSTGMALQDAATAVVVLERARANRLGVEVRFAPEPEPELSASLDVLFVCQHGAAKSVIAARHLAALARSRGLPLNAAAAGVEPDEAIPAHVIAGLRGDGLEDQGATPQAVTRELLENAQIVVSFGCDLSAFAESSGRIVQWNDVPAVSDGYDAARAAILSRLEAIVEEAEQHSSGEHRE